MDYRSLNQAIADMNDEELLSIERKASDERKRRLVVNLGSTPQPGQRLLIDFAPMVNEVRESVRKELRMSSEAVLASVLEQLPQLRSEVNEPLVIEALRAALTFNLIHEADCEMKRRLDSVR
jgi:hypothetical protein